MYLSAYLQMSKTVCQVWQVRKLYNMSKVSTNILGIVELMSIYLLFSQDGYVRWFKTWNQWLQVTSFRSDSRNSRNSSNLPHWSRVVSHLLLRWSLRIIPTIDLGELSLISMTTKCWILFSFLYYKLIDKSHVYKIINKTKSNNHKIQMKHKQNRNAFLQFLHDLNQTNLLFSLLYNTLSLLLESPISSMLTGPLFLGFSQMPSPGLQMHNVMPSFSQNFLLQLLYYEYWINCSFPEH